MIAQRTSTVRSCAGVSRPSLFSLIIGEAARQNRAGNVDLATLLGAESIVGMTADQAIAATTSPTLSDSLQAMGETVRRHRRRLGLTLDELAIKAGLSKPYLSLFETARTPNPPSEQKLLSLEKALDLPTRSLADRADLLRAPPSVRTLIHRLLARTTK